MGVLDDAIREHLELKRKHGAPEGEVEQQEREVLGALQHEPVEPAETPAAAPAETAEPAQEEAPPAEPETPAPVEDEPDWGFEPEPSAEDDAPAGSDTPPRGFERIEDVEPSADDEGEGDVLEETPDFLEETPEHDRLWFEQKPPRDFDFDDDK